MNHNNFDSEFLYMEIKEGIIRAKYKSERIDASVAEQAIQVRLDFTKQQVLPVLVDVSSVKYVTKEAREILSSERAGERVAASAAVIENAVTRSIARFFFKFQHPHYPFKIFNNVESAEHWLKEYKNIY